MGAAEIGVRDCCDVGGPAGGVLLNRLGSAPAARAARVLRALPDVDPCLVAASDPFRSSWSWWRTSARPWPCPGRAGGRVVPESPVGAGRRPARLLPSRRHSRPPAGCGTRRSRRPCRGCPARGPGGAQAVVCWDRRVGSDTARAGLAAVVPGSIPPRRPCCLVGLGVGGAVVVHPGLDACRHRCRTGPASPWRSRSPWHNTEVTQRGRAPAAAAATPPQRRGGGSRRPERAIPTRDLLNAPLEAQRERRAHRPETTTVLQRIVGIRRRGLSADSVPSFSGTRRRPTSGGRQASASRWPSFAPSVVTWSHGYHRPPHRSPGCATPRRCRPASLVAAGLAALGDSLTTATSVLVLVLVVVGVGAAGPGRRRARGRLERALGRLLPHRADPPVRHQCPDDVEVVLLLVAVGAAVTEIALWGCRQQARAARRAGFLDGVLGERRPRGRGGRRPRRRPSARRRPDHRGARSRPVPLRAAGRRRAGGSHCCGATAPSSAMARLLAVERDGLPTDVEIVLPVPGPGGSTGHFRLTAASRVLRPGLEQRRVAVLLADQCAALPDPRLDPARARLLWTARGAAEARRRFGRAARRGACCRGCSLPPRTARGTRPGRSARPACAARSR